MEEKVEETKNDQKILSEVFGLKKKTIVLYKTERLTSTLFESLLLSTDTGHFLASGLERFSTDNNTIE